MKHKALITSILLWIYFLANAQNKSGLIIYDIKYPNEKMFLAKMKLIEYPTNQEFDVHEPVEKEKKTIQDHVYSQDHIEDFLLEKLNSKAPKGIRFTKAQNKTCNNRKFKTERVYEWEK